MCLCASVAVLVIVWEKPLLLYMTYVKTFFLIFGCLCFDFLQSQFFFNTISCRRLFLSSGSFSVEAIVTPIDFCFNFVVCLFVTLILCVLLSFWASVVSCHVQCAVSVCRCATSHTLLHSVVCTITVLVSVSFWVLLFASFLLFCFSTFFLSQGLLLSDAKNPVSEKKKT